MGDGLSAKPKKRRWRRNDPPKRHWVLQEKSEFREKMEAKKRRKIDPNAAAAFEDSSRVSNRYEGLPEYNTSQYVLISLGATVDPKTMEQQQQQQQQPPTKRVPEQLNITPVFGITSFSQPAKLKTLSMHEAEEAISNQRDNMTRYMMHGKMSKVGVGMDDAPPVRVGMRLGPPPKGGMAKARLLGKLVKKVRIGHRFCMSGVCICAFFLFVTCSGLFVCHLFEVCCFLWKEIQEWKHKWLCFVKKNSKML